jgi:hypothetical protein
VSSIARENAREKQPYCHRCPKGVPQLLDPPAVAERILGGLHVWTAVDPLVRAAWGMKAAVAKMPNGRPLSSAALALSHWAVNHSIDGQIMHGRKQLAEALGLNEDTIRRDGLPQLVALGLLVKEASKGGRAGKGGRASTYRMNLLGCGSADHARAWQLGQGLSSGGLAPQLDPKQIAEQVGGQGLSSGGTLGPKWGDKASQLGGQTPTHAVAHAVAHAVPQAGAAPVVSFSEQKSESQSQASRAKQPSQQHQAPEGQGRLGMEPEQDDEPIVIEDDEPTGDTGVDHLIKEFGPQPEPMMTLASVRRRWRKLILMEGRAFAEERRTIQTLAKRDPERMDQAYQAAERNDRGNVTPDALLSAWAEAGRKTVTGDDIRTRYLLLRLPADPEAAKRDRKRVIAAANQDLARLDRAYAAAQRNENGNVWAHSLIDAWAQVGEAQEAAR